MKLSLSFKDFDTVNRSGQLKTDLSFRFWHWRPQLEVCEMKKKIGDKRMCNDGVVTFDLITNKV